MIFFSQYGFSQSSEFEENFGFQHGDIAVADIDGDGDLDVIASWKNGSGPISWIFLNDNGSFFMQSDNSINPAYFADIKFYDEDGEGVVIWMWFIVGKMVMRKFSRDIAHNDGGGVFTKTDLDVADATTLFKPKMCYSLNRNSYLIWLIKVYFVIKSESIFLILNSMNAFFTCSEWKADVYTL